VDLSRAHLYVAGAILLLICHLAGGRVRPYAGEWKPLAICAVFNVTLWHMLTAYALIAMGTSHVALLAHTMPVWAALIAVCVLASASRRALALATALGAAGIVALFWRHVSLVADAPFAPCSGWAPPSPGRSARSTRRAAAGRCRSWR
jgi:drug/metabolite transporter (DMT)-like permease